MRNQNAAIDGILLRVGDIAKRSPTPPNRNHPKSVASITLLHDPVSRDGHHIGRPGAFPYGWAETPNGVLSRTAKGFER